MSQSRPKPWEVSSGNQSSSMSTSSSSSIPNNNRIGSPTSASTAAASNQVPDLPSKPTSLSSTPSSTNPLPQPTTLNSTSAGLSRTSPYSTTGLPTYGSTGNGMYGSGYGSGAGMYGSGMYGGSSYGSGMYGGSSYGSGMYGSRVGGMYGSSYGGMYGSSYGGMNGMGMGMGMGMNGQPGMIGSLTQGTEATFQLIESMIGAFGGFTQMLESTYYATHNSFFTMMSVAEQFQHLKNALGSLLGIYTLMSWAKKILKKIRGVKSSLSVEEFKKFQKRLENGVSQSSGQHDANGASSNPSSPDRISLKPLVLFLAAVFGLPYLMKQLVNRLAQQQQQHLLEQGQQIPLQQQQQQAQTNYLSPQSSIPGNPSAQAIINGGQLQQQQIQPSQLSFARVLYDFNPENEEVELKLKKGDLLAILNRTDANGNESNWWKCRSRDGRLGFVPFNYLEIIKRGSASEGGKIKAIEQASVGKNNAVLDVDEFKKV